MAGGSIIALSAPCRDKECNTMSEIDNNIILQVRHELAKIGIEQTPDEIRNDEDVIETLSEVNSIKDMPEFHELVDLLNDPNELKAFQDQYERTTGKKIGDKEFKAGIAIVKLFIRK